VNDELGKVWKGKICDQFDSTVISFPCRN